MEEVIFLLRLKDVLGKSIDREQGMFVRERKLPDLFLVAKGAIEGLVFEGQ